MDQADYHNSVQEDILLGIQAVDPQQARRNRSAVETLPVQVVALKEGDLDDLASYQEQLAGFELVIHCSTEIKVVQMRTILVFLDLATMQVEDLLKLVGDSERVVQLVEEEILVE